MKTMLNTSNEDGFTLIEILVVILIIGILAAIAIPVFLNQRQTANDATAVSDTKNVAMAMQSYFTDNPTATYAPVEEIRKLVKESPNVSIAIMGTSNDYCIHDGIPMESNTPDRHGLMDPSHTIHTVASKVAGEQ